MCDKDVNNEGKIPLILYKYMKITKFKKYHESYLKGKLYFADRQSLNDPMENAPLIDRFILKGGSDNEYKEYMELFERFKICSLTPYPNNFAMWSHYANNHSGVCIGFKICPEKLDENIIMSEKVIYDPKDLIPVVEVYCYENINSKDVQKLFSSKLKSWKYEDECRLLVASDETRMFQVGEVTDIILGYKCKLKPEKIKKWLSHEQQSKVNVRCVEYQKAGNEGIRLVAQISNISPATEFLPISDWEYVVAERGIRISRYEHNFDKAITECNKLIEFNPNTAWIYNNRGIVYAENGKFDEAIDDFTTALAIKPDFHEALNNRGNAYAEKGELDKAIGDFTAALTIKPDDFEKFKNHGFAYLGKCEYDNTIEDCDKSLDIKPDYLEAIKTRILVNVIKVDCDKVFEDCKYAIKIDPTNAKLYSQYAAAVYGTRAMAYKGKGQKELAINDLEKALSINPNYQWAKDLLKEIRGW